MKLTPDGGRSFKQLWASLPLLPATKGSFLHLQMEKAGDSKTTLNSVSFPAGSAACSTLTAHKLCHHQRLFREGRMTGSCPQLLEKKRTKDERARGRDGMYLHGCLSRRLFIRHYEVIYL